MLLFFTMFIVGITSQSYMIDIIINALYYTFDIEESFRNSLVAQVCTAFFCFGLIMTTTAGAVIIDYTIHVIHDLPFLVTIFMIIGLILSSKYARIISNLIQVM